jgi:hypothetical protein
MLVWIRLIRMCNTLHIFARQSRYWFKPIFSTTVGDFLSKYLLPVNDMQTTQ